MFFAGIWPYCLLKDFQLAVLKNTLSTVKQNSDFEIADELKNI